ncbi:TPA: DUF1372 family protein [Streptococcus suis]|nr:DUF1372 family protein [Streptococcus suis]HEM6431668.1 DUF1372 family protein [Streptococcus suis]
MKEAIKFVMVMLVLTFAISMSAIYKLKKQVEQLEARKPVIIYQVDNAGIEMFGIEIGQEMPDYLKGWKQ